MAQGSGKKGKNSSTNKSKTATKRATKSKKIVVTSDEISGRMDQRIPIQLLVDYKADGHYLFDFCRDLGTGGVFIQTENPLDAGSELDLVFTIPDSKETLRTKGKVIWVQDKVEGRDDLSSGMGVQFLGFSDKDRRLLENFIERYHGKNIYKQDLASVKEKSA